MIEKLSPLVEAGNSFLSSAPIQNLVTALITTLFLRHDTSAKTVEEIKVKRLDEVAEELLKQGKMSYMEYYKCKNFQKVAELADKYYPLVKETQEHNENETDSQSENMDFDWFMRFFDAVGNISNQDMQDLWGKLLAAELSHPKTCSLRTLDTIRNMSSAEAKSFEKLARLVLHSGHVSYIPSFGFFDIHNGYENCSSYIKQLGLNYTDDIMPLEEAGILDGDHDISVYLSKDSEPLMITNGQIVFIVSGESDEPELLKQDSYMLTNSGKELYQIVSAISGYEVDSKYAELCMDELKKLCPSLSFSSFNISNTHAY